MTIRRESRKVSPEQRAKERSLRAKYQAEQPSLEQLKASGGFLGPLAQGSYFAVQFLAKHLREVREQQGLSLADVAQRTGIDKGALSKLETGVASNPTIETLERYAQALGKRLMLGLEDRGSSRYSSPRGQ